MADLAARFWSRPLLGSRGRAGPRHRPCRIRAPGREPRRPRVVVVPDGLGARGGLMLVPALMPLRERRASGCNGSAERGEASRAVAAVAADPPRMLLVSAGGATRRMPRHRHRRVMPPLVTHLLSDGRAGDGSAAAGDGRLGGRVRRCGRRLQIGDESRESALDAGRLAVHPDSAASGSSSRPVRVVRPPRERLGFIAARAAIRRFDSAIRLGASPGSWSADASTSRWSDNRANVIERRRRVTSARAADPCRTRSRRTSGRARGATFFTSLRVARAARDR